MEAITCSYLYPYRPAFGQHQDMERQGMVERSAARHLGLIGSRMAKPLPSTAELWMEKNRRDETSQAIER